MEQSYGVAAGILIFTSKYVYVFQYVFLMLQTLIFMLQESILNVATEHPMGNFLTDVRALAAPYFFIKSRTNVLCLRESKNTRNITIETTFLQMFMSVSHTCILVLLRESKNT